MTFDLALFQTATTTGTPYVQSPGLDTGGRALAGPEKLAQRFLAELLTERGSLSWLAERGTDFAALAAPGTALTEADVLAAFHGALWDAGTNLESEESDDDPDNERFAGATLRSMSVAQGALTIHVVVSSRSGAQADLSIPLSFS